MARLVDRLRQAQQAIGDSIREILPNRTGLEQEGTVADHSNQELPCAGFWRRLGDVSSIAGCEAHKDGWCEKCLDLHYSRLDSCRLPGRRSGGCG